MNVARITRQQYMRALDLPPVWLIGALIVAWLISMMTNQEPSGGFASWFGTALIVYGVALVAVALFEMIRARTTFIPGRDPDVLVTSGIFDWSRNPIYLGDVLILTGAILRWEAYPALILVPEFVWLIQQRFVLEEEGRLASHFGKDWDDYAQNVRRWI